MRRRLLPRAPEAPAEGLSVAALAPFVDMMTLLLVFLLRTWATEPSPAPAAVSFTPALTLSEAPRRGGLSLVVGRDAAWLDGRALPVDAVAGESALVRPLYDALLVQRGTPVLEIVADAEVPWKRLRAFIDTARAAGVEDIALVGESRVGG